MCRNMLLFCAKTNPILNEKEPKQKRECIIQRLEKEHMKKRHFSFALVGISALQLQRLLPILAELFKIGGFSSSLVPGGMVDYSHVLFLPFQKVTVAQVIRFIIRSWPGRRGCVCAENKATHVEIFNGHLLILLSYQ